MSTKHDDGGPAYPVPSSVFEHVTKGELVGMTLWDFYAAAALQGISSTEYSDEMTTGEIADEAAQLADDMLAERRKRGIGQ